MRVDGNILTRPSLSGPFHCVHTLLFRNSGQKFYSSLLIGAIGVSHIAFFTFYHHRIVANNLLVNNTYGIVRTYVIKRNTWYILNNLTWFCEEIENDFVLACI